jgi:hypothetical protein
MPEEISPERNSEPISDKERERLWLYFQDGYGDRPMGYDWTAREMILPTDPIPDDAKKDIVDPEVLDDPF